MMTHRLYRLSFAQVGSISSINDSFSFKKSCLGNVGPITCNVIVFLKVIVILEDGPLYFVGSEGQ